MPQLADDRFFSKNRCFGLNEQPPNPKGIPMNQTHNRIACILFMAVAAGFGVLVVMGMFDLDFPTFF